MMISYSASAANIKHINTDNTLSIIKGFFLPFPEIILERDKGNSAGDHLRQTGGSRHRHKRSVCRRSKSQELCTNLPAGGIPVRMGKRRKQMLLKAIDKGGQCKASIKNTINRV
jgi:hypothetical protein